MGNNRADILNLLREINDPEIPVVNIVEMGIVRDVQTTEDGTEVLITPTYSGCPAMKQIKDDIRELLDSKGYSSVSVKTVYSPAWTTEWLNEETKEKLRNYGIAPPGSLPENGQSPFSYSFAQVNCPFCRSDQTEIRSPFGSTACKALYYCRNCHQPFEHFKCI